ncbi:MAG TPA: tetratricopeptide repeat protein [Planktothrix sp.]|jgi:tetratricopeptide (TPR) repeat protein
MNNHKDQIVVALATTLLLGASFSSTAFARTYSGAHRKPSLQGRVSREVVQADQAMKNNKYDLAENLYHDALNRNKNDLSARVGLGMVYAKTFKLDRADEELDKALKLDPQSPIALCGKATVIVNRLQSSSTEWSKNKQALLNQAQAYANRAVQADANSPEANYTLGTVLKEQGNLDQAASAFNKAIACDKEYSDAYAGLGLVYLKKNDFAGAITNFKQALSYNTGNSTAHYGLGRTFIQQGQLEAGIKELNTSLYQYRNSAPVHFELGRAYELQGNTVGAIQQFQESIRIKPEMAAPYIHVADIRENRGDIEHAIAELRSGLELNPNNPELLLRVANDNLRLEKIDDSIKAYEQVLAVAPKSSQAAEGLTRAFYLKAQKESTGAFFASNDYEAAQHSIDRAVQMNPNNMELRLAQAKLNALSGKQIDLNALGTPNNDGERVAYAEALLAQNKFQESSQQMNMLISSIAQPKQLLALGDLSLMIKDFDSANAAYNKAAGMPGNEERAKRGLDQVAKAKEVARQDLTLATDLARKKQLASAVDKFHAAVFENPRNADARDGLATALEKLYPNDPKELRESSTQYRAFLALAPNTPPKEQEKLQKRIAKLDNKASKLESEMASVPRKTSMLSKLQFKK